MLSEAFFQQNKTAKYEGNKTHIYSIVLNETKVSTKALQKGQCPGRISLYIYIYIYISVSFKRILPKNVVSASDGFLTAVGLRSLLFGA